MTAVPTTLRSVDAVPAEQVHAAFGLAFSDYLIGPFVIALGQWPQFLARQGVEPGLSRVALNEAGEILAFAFVAPRPTRWRLATMGALPAARGSGAARQLLDDFLHRAAQAGLAEVELEVFAQNERARRLYEGRGFTTLHELHGYEAAPLGGERQLLPAAITVADREQAFAWIEQVALLDVRDLPLQVTPTALRVSPSVLQALQLGSAQLLFAETAPQLLGIASLIDRNPAQVDARSLVQALRASHPDHRITVPQLQRLDLGGQALRDCGFAVLPLHQLLMRAIVQN